MKGKGNQETHVYIHKYYACADSEDEDEDVDEDEVYYALYISDTLVSDFDHELIRVEMDSKEHKSALKDEEEWLKYHREGRKMSRLEKAKEHTQRMLYILEQSRYWSFNKTLLYWHKYNQHYLEAQHKEFKAQQREDKKKRK